MNAQLMYEPIVLEHFQPDGLNVVKFFFSRDLFADVMSVRSRNGLNVVKFFFSRDLFADVMSVHSRNMKHAHAIEFYKTNLRAML